MNKWVLYVAGVVLFSITSSTAFAGMRAEAKKEFKPKEYAGEAELSDDLEHLTDLFPAPEEADEELQTLGRTTELRASDREYRELWKPVLRVPEYYPVDLILRIVKNPGKKKLQRLEVIDVRQNNTIIETFTVTTGNPNRWTTLKNGDRVKSAETPSGWFTIHFKARVAESMAYDGSKMPHFLAFAAGKRRNSFGIHGHAIVTGYRGSGGCVRMYFKSAAKLWAIVHNIGKDDGQGGFSNILVNVI